jgi:hypothetical protein
MNGTCSVHPRSGGSPIEVNRGGSLEECYVILEVRVDVPVAVDP